MFSDIFSRLYICIVSYVLSNDKIALVNFKYMSKFLLNNTTTIRWNNDPTWINKGYYSTVNKPLIGWARTQNA